MTIHCAECGASLIDGGTCKDHFHSLLILESQVVGDPKVTGDGRGEVIHFYAVSAYILQHPDTMKYTQEALDGLRKMIGEHLAGDIDLPALRTRVRHEADGATRITRRIDDPVVNWPITTWPIDVTDVLAGGPDEYFDRVTRWAASIIQTLNTSAIKTSDR